MLLEITVVTVVIELDMEKEKRKSALINQFVNHDMAVWEDELHGLEEFVNKAGFVSIYEYYYNFTDEELNEIARDYFEEEDYIRI